MTDLHHLHTVPSGTKPKFLNEYAPTVFKSLVSKTRAKKAIQKGELLVNGKHVASDYRLVAGDTIELKAKQTSNKKVLEESLEVLFEDDYMAVINKPGGLPVNGNTFKTLENALPHNLKPSKQSDALPAPLPVHRLDVPTCGLVMVAKTVAAQIKLGKMLQGKDVSKIYHAVVVGEPKERKGTIEEPIENKPCITEYEVLEVLPSQKYGKLSYVALSPVTGRTHQLRIHMADLGHPIIGDEYYTRDIDLLKGKGLFLCAMNLQLNHPVTGNVLDIKIEVPRKFKKFMEREAYMASR